MVGFITYVPNSKESDKTDVKYTYLPKLAKAFGVPVRELLPTDEAEPPTASTRPAGPATDHRDELITLQRCRIQQLESEIVELKSRVYGGG